MNKLMTATALMLAMAGAAQAEGMMQAAKDMTKTMRPYVGVDYSRVMADYDDSFTKFAVEDDFDGVNPYVGVQFNKYVAAEVGYLQTAEGNKVSNAAGGKTKTDISGLGVDVVGHYPIHPCLDALGSVGVGRYEIDTDGSVAGNDEETALRLGAGAQYQLTDNVGVRAMLRYIDVEFEGSTNYLMTGDIGVNYRF